MARTAKARRRVTKDAVDIAFAAPMVIGHRIGRAMLQPNLPATRREHQRMHTEKWDAWLEGWTAMGMEALRLQQGMAFSWWGAGFDPWKVAAAGMAPVRRRAVANAKRLGRTR